MPKYVSRGLLFQGLTIQILHSILQLEYWFQEYPSDTHGRESVRRWPLSRTLVCAGSCGRYDFSVVPTFPTSISRDSLYATHGVSEQSD